MLKALAGVRANELEQALLLLPYTDALRLLTYLCHWLRKGLQARWGMGIDNMDGAASCYIMAIAYSMLAFLTFMLFKLAQHLICA